MAYDAARGQTVLFGGGNSSGLLLFASPVGLGDTWVWDGAAWQERQVPGPPSRCLHAMAYDSGRARVVLFGGSIGSTATLAAVLPSAAPLLGSTYCQQGFVVDPGAPGMATVSNAACETIGAK